MSTLILKTDSEDRLLQLDSKGHHLLIRESSVISLWSICQDTIESFNPSTLIVRSDDDYELGYKDYGSERLAKEAFASAMLTPEVFINNFKKTMTQIGGWENLVGDVLRST